MPALFAAAIATNPSSASAAKWSPLTTPFPIPSCPRLGFFVPFGKRPQRTGLRAYSPSSVSSSTVLSAHERSAEVEQQAEEKEEKFDWFGNWYPVAPVCDLDKRVPHAKRVMGLDLVVWWDRAAGKWQVFDDRCPHRLAPLSEGRIDRNGRLQCVYHGWCFDGSGGCNYIPQAPQDGPPVHTSKRACAFVYPSLEQNGIVWFWPRTDPQYKDIGEKLKPPLLPKVDDPSYTSLLASRDIPYGYEVLVENLMDPAHVSYAHYGIMPTARRDPPDFVQRDREGGRPLDIAVKKLDAAGFVAMQEDGYSKFIAPCLFYSFASFGSNSKPDPQVAEDLSDQKNVVMIFICVPVAPGRSRLILAFPRNFALWMDKIVPRWIFHIVQNLVIDSDLYLLHLEERKIEDIGQSNWQTACFVPTKSDALVVAFRKWLRKYSNGQIEWGTKFGGLPQPIPREQLMDRYYSHVVNCSSCRTAVTALKALEVCLQVLPIALIGIVAVANGTLVPSMARKALVFTAVSCFLVSKWLGNFIYKTFYFHDYIHAFK